MRPRIAPVHCAAGSEGETNFGCVARRTEGRVIEGCQISSQRGLPSCDHMSLPSGPGSSAACWRQRNQAGIHCNLSTNESAAAIHCTSRHSNRSDRSPKTNR